MGLLLVLCVGNPRCWGGSFGCLAGLGSRVVALVKKRSPVFEKEWSKGVVNEKGSWSNFLGPVRRVFRLGLRSFRVVGLLGDTCEICVHAQSSRD